MSKVLKYLSFEGRSNRKRYWLTALSIFGLVVASMLVVMSAAAFLPILGLIGIPLYLALVVAILANAARRLHDRNKSAWWLLLFYVLPTLMGIPLRLAGDSAADDVQLAALGLAVLGLPFSIWGLVELGFLKGTAGPNRFGEDPLPARQEPAFA